MPKKTAATRGGSQRNKPRVRAQKSFEVVRQIPDEHEQEPEAVDSAEPTAVSVSTMSAPEVKETKSKSSANGAVKKSESISSDTSTVAAPKGSASARLAARRQTMQKAQQRVATSLITSEHYSYVRKDLIIIAILAVIMFSTIIILHFVPGIGY